MEAGLVKGCAPAKLPASLPLAARARVSALDGDPAAAYRYTECRMEALAEAMLADIDMETAVATAFQGRVIADIAHPILRRLRGEL